MIDRTVATAPTRPTQKGAPMISFQGCDNVPVSGFTGTPVNLGYLSIRLQLENAKSLAPPMMSPSGQP